MPFLLVANTDRKWGTIERYKMAIRLHIAPYIGTRNIATLSRRDVADFYARLREDGRGPATIRQVHAILAGAFNAAVDLEELPKSPVDRQKLPKPVSGEVEIPTADKVEDMLELARETEHPLFAAIWLAAHTGLRRGEVMGLEWKHINVLEKYIDVKQSLGYSHAERRSIVDKPKTKASVRRVYLDSVTVDVLMAHRTAQDAHRDAMRDAYDSKGIVFANATGGWYFPGSLSGAVKSLSSRVGPPFHLHALRHYHTSMMLEDSKNAVLVAKRLGHSSTKMTLDVYGHVL